MNARDDENCYRGLLESAQKGIENAKAFLEAVGTSEAALKNVAMGLAIVKHPLPGGDTIEKRVQSQTGGNQFWSSIGDLVGGIAGGFTKSIAGGG